MIFFIIIICIPLAALLVFLFATFRFTITYKEKKFKITVGGKYTYFTLYNSEKDEKDKKENKKKKDYIKIPTFEGFKNKYSALKRIFDEEKDEVILILKSINANADIETFDISVTFGFGDAAVTGIANGIIWSVITAVNSFLIRYLDIGEITNIAVFPSYTEKCFDVDVVFVFDTKLYKSIGILRRIHKLIERNKMQFNN